MNTNQPPGPLNEQKTLQAPWRSHGLYEFKLVVSRDAEPCILPAISPVRAGQPVTALQYVRSRRIVYGQCAPEAGAPLVDERAGPRWIK